MKACALLAAAALAAACGAQGDAKAEAPAAQQGQRAPVVVKHRPPTAKDVIDAVLASAHVPLSVSPTCRNVGTEPADRTLGRYLAGFMAGMSRESDRNWIETHVEPGPASDREPVWICRMTLRHADDRDLWGWGVLFRVRQRDGRVLEDSFVCTGSG
ncbi:MAG: hypothetical protein U1F54_13540 [Burkholderiales bacterium]